MSENEMKMNPDTLAFLREHLTEEEIVKLDVLVNSLSEYVAELCIKVRKRRGV